MDYAKIAAAVNQEFGLPKAGNFVDCNMVHEIATGVNKTENHPVIERVRVHVKQAQAEESKPKRK